MRRKAFLLKTNTNISYDFLNWTLYGQSSEFRPEISYRDKPEELSEALKTNLPAADLKHYLGHRSPQQVEKDGQLPLDQQFGREAERTARLSLRQRYHTRRLARKLLTGKI